MQLEQSAESTALVERLLEQQREMMREQREEFKVERAEMEARLTEQREAMEAKLEAKDARVAELTAAPTEAISDAEIAALQARLESLHAAKLFADEELYALEDLVADFVELTASMPSGVTEAAIYSSPGNTFHAASKLHKLVRLSAAMAGDAAFARQARRKYL